MTDLLEVLPRVANQKLRKKKQPREWNPMPATLSQETYSRAGWIF